MYIKARVHIPTVLFVWKGIMVRGSGQTPHVWRSRKAASYA